MIFAAKLHVHCGHKAELHVAIDEDGQVEILRLSDNADDALLSVGIQKKHANMLVHVHAALCPTGRHLAKWSS